MSPPTTTFAAIASSAPLALLALFAGELVSWAGVPAIGAVAMGTAGALASQGILQLWEVLTIGALGAQVGGMIGWWLGRSAARRAAQRAAQRPERDGRLAQRGRRAVQSGRRLSLRVGGATVFFVPSWVSGWLGMSGRRFATWNLLASILWTLAAGLGAYGAASAITGRSLVHVLIPIAIACAALAGIALAFRQWRRSHLARQAIGLD